MNIIRQALWGKKKKKVIPHTIKRLKRFPCIMFVEVLNPSLVVTRFPLTSDYVLHISGLHFFFLNPDSDLAIPRCVHYRIASSLSRASQEARRWGNYTQLCTHRTHFPGCWVFCTSTSTRELFNQVFSCHESSISWLWSKTNGRLRSRDAVSPQQAALREESIPCCVSIVTVH